ncbi:MAG: hypothetical protein ACRCZN_10055 [Lactococcus lactis]
MKLSEIEAVKEVNTWIGGLPYTVEPVDKLHTPEQMQDYAKECVREAIILNSGGAVSDDMIKRAIDSVFTEDTKNE